MFLRAHTLLIVFFATSLTVTAVPTPLGHTTPKYTSSRIIYRETPSTIRLNKQKHESHSVHESDSSHSYPIYKQPKLPYHANLNFGDHDDDGPEILSGSKSSESKLAFSGPKLKRLYGRDGDAMRGNHCTSLLGPQNVPLDEQDLDLSSPTETGSGKVDNFKWSFSSIRNWLTKGGWARQQNEKHLPVVKDLPAVNMRLKPGDIREMHWRVTGGWAYVLKGSLRVSVLSPDGSNKGVEYVVDVNEGDLWYFPAGYPHSIQTKDTLPEGAEFLLIFDASTFGENDTFLHTDWLAYVPKEVLAKNFETHPDATPFDRIPEHELYSNPPQENMNEDTVISKPIDPRFFFIYPLSKIEPMKFPGGKIKIADSRSFGAAKKIVVAEVSVEAGAMRELRGHPAQPKWIFILSGKARITLFAAQSAYDFFPGDVIYIPPLFGHCIENIGDEPLKILEVLKTGFDLKFIETIPREKEEIVAPEV